MAANISPIFPLTPKVWISALITAANTNKDGTGTVTQISSPAGPNGAFVESVEALPIGTNNASVLRVFLNIGSSPSSAANNILWEEVSLPATLLTEVAAQAKVVIPLNRAIPAGYTLYATMGTAVAAGWRVRAHTGDY
ncbi:hypothetical protein UNDYM_3733 [Undibacterium sp. YM2]|uniref:hypothetical protein n=1 Tax=Undibacterium sp. YM2 TaxID=2058625 RepID=UPI001331CA14|nr:hypothetical protein [Undibacterium sp. YM2]BBB67986.1 hypothetical protein UNDYM_3733 [Undibacterium sp. YM2]